MEIPYAASGLPDGTEFRAGGVQIDGAGGGKGFPFRGVYGDGNGLLESLEDREGGGDGPGVLFDGGKQRRRERRQDGSDGERERFFKTLPPV